MLLFPVFILICPYCCGLFDLFVKAQVKRRWNAVETQVERIWDVYQRVRAPFQNIQKPEFIMSRKWLMA